MKFSQPAKFRKLRNFATCEIDFPAPLFKFPALLIVHPTFDFLTSFGHFLVCFPFCPLVIAFAFVFFSILN